MINRDNDPFENLHRTLVTSSRNHSLDHRDAWIYGIIVGWEDGEDDPDSALMEVADRHGWSLATVERLRDLRRNFLVAAKNCKEVYQRR